MSDRQQSPGTATQPKYARPGVVKEVNEAANTCTVALVTIEGETTLEGELLECVNCYNGIAVTLPEINSLVLVADLEAPGEWMLVKAYRIARLRIKINDSSYMDIADGNVVMKIQTEIGNP